VVTNLLIGSIRSLVTGTVSQRHRGPVQKSDEGGEIAGNGNADFGRRHLLIEELAD
jgi:hypothetical protein